MKYIGYVIDQLATEYVVDDFILFIPSGKDDADIFYNNRYYKVENNHAINKR